ncbi:alanine racemase [Denitrobaculum tricleocarpae]|uniref:Alanine racemase n=1 Tax=Denitrobaculum tricleocarpae TaxID=2591009 RepID=A0A545TTY5_9PROT|nr:alanine racemase [Denitrobaculum tricleocarpae]TQV80687.1 alanine racemase [Denitrobaculum tricleocarpae]
MSSPLQSAAAARAGGRLTIDLAALKSNYRRLCEEIGPGVACAAAVKADGYGLGIGRVGPALADAGVRRFFVAHFDEALRLKSALAARTPSAVVAACEIFVLNGLIAAPSADYLGEDVRPVLNSLGEVDQWHKASAAADKALPAALHVDTGMCRLGLPDNEFQTLMSSRARLKGIDLRVIMSHLACADMPDHPLNQQQLAAFKEIRAAFADTPASFANSSGIFLGPDYHFDVARPGVALYGINPLPGRVNPMRQVVRLQGKILQLREIDAPQSVGYGAAYQAAGPMRIATVAVGYADGYLRALSDRGHAWIGDRRIDVVGRVSMDLLALDVTAIPGDAAVPGTFVDLFDPETGADSLAAEAGTIGYEILTSLGQRYHREYLGD